MSAAPPHIVPPATVPGLFVAVGYHGLRMVSRNGTDWSAPVLGRESEVYRAVCFGNGRYVAVGTHGGSNLFAVSRDGREWRSSMKDGRYALMLRGLTFGAGSFIAYGGDAGPPAQNVVYRSTDGAVWSDMDRSEGRTMMRRIAHGGSLFVGVGDYGRRAVARDAVAWRDVPGVRPIETLVDVAFGNGVFVGGGLHSLRMSSRDGLTWGRPLVGEEGEHLNSIVWARDRFVAAGPNVTYFSPDGETWTRRPNRNGPLTMTYGNGTFVGAQWKGRLLVSTDAVEWRQVVKADHHVEGLGYGG